MAEEEIDIVVGHIQKLWHEHRSNLINSLKELKFTEEGNGEELAKFIVSTLASFTELSFNMICNGNPKYSAPLRHTLILKIMECGGREIAEFEKSSEAQVH